MSGHRCANCGRRCDCQPEGGGCAWCSDCQREVLYEDEDDPVERALRSGEMPS